MRVLRRAWPLAGALFVTLASADIAWGGPAAGVPTPDRTVTSQTAGETDGSTFHLFGKTWCFGRAPHAVTCDHTVPARRDSSDRPLDKVMTALRRLFTGSPTAPAAGDQGQNRG
jgi:hypothetical protein